MTAKPKKRRISVQSAKAKGAIHQRWTRDLILELFPELEPDDVRSASGGVTGEDIQLSPAARRVIPLSIECKANARIAVYKFYDQAKENCPKGMEPIVVMKADRKKPLVLLDARRFFEIMKELRHGR